MSAVFEARFRSVCLACEEWIQAGQAARYVEGVVVHDDCDKSSPVEGAGTPCASCFQVPSVNGVCGCEDLSPEWTI